MIDEQRNDSVDVQRLRQFVRSSVTPSISTVSAPSRLVGWQQAAKTWHRSMADSIVGLCCSMRLLLSEFTLRAA